MRIATEIDMWATRWGKLPQFCTTDSWLLMMILPHMISCTMSSSQGKSLVYTGEDRQVVSFLAPCSTSYQAAPVQLAPTRLTPSNRLNWEMLLSRPRSKVSGIVGQISPAPQCGPHIVESTYCIQTIWIVFYLIQLSTTLDHQMYEFKQGSISLEFGAF